MDRDDSSLGDRYGDRLEDDQTRDSVGEETEDEDAYPSMGVEQSVKKEWKLYSFYLPASIGDSLDDAYRDRRYESEDRLQKGRHFYPLIAALGLERVESMDSVEIKERLEEMEV